MRPFLHGEPSTKQASKRQEDRVARQIGGRRQPASGALPGRKGDVDAGAFLGELKYTLAASYRLTQADLRKITLEAAADGKRPFFWVEFREALEQPGEAYVVFPAWVVQDWLEVQDGARDTTTARR